MKPTTIPLCGFFALIILSVILLSSCNKEPDLVGLDLLPPSDRLGASYTDTTTIVAYSVYEDSVLTSGMTYGVIGSIYDKDFGKTTASLFTQIRMTSNAPTFGTNPVVDSVVLVLPYSGLFGDSAALQTFKVYELSESLIADKKYYSNNPPLGQGALLAEKTFLPRVKDSVFIDSITKIIPQLRIKFNEQFGEKIKNASANDLADNDKFVEFFKGIVITDSSESNPESGSMVSFNLLSTISFLKMYYHNTEDTLVYNFAITTESIRFNRYEHGYSVASTDFKQQLNGDTTQGRQKLFIQAFGGTKVKLQFPYLKKWAADKKIAINNAQLILTKSDLTAPYRNPAMLALRAILTDTTQSSLVDENEGTIYFGGVYNGSSGYSFRISRYIQQILNSSSVEKDKGLYLSVAGASYVGNRLILNGTSPSLNWNNRMKIEITYTIIK
ncbi:MAG: DUF4270 domain-containing protein [Bacteroidales bacterium]